MNQENRNIKIPLLIGIGFLLIIVLLEFLDIMRLNNGLLVYTLDDPYIHLSLAQQILKGHYGINAGEFSAPSSTILWPFILAPFASSLYFPFLLNTVFAIATVFFFLKILSSAFAIKERRTKNIFLTSILILLILSTNLVGLIFTGMEHSLQVLIVVIIVYGMIAKEVNNKLSPWLLIAIAAAPLIRYENVGISFAAIIYLLMNGYYKRALSVSIIIIVLVGAFSLFLISLGLDPLPTSVMIKSSVIGSGITLHSFLGNVWHTLTDTQGIILSLLATAFLTFLIFGKDIKKKSLALTVLIALLLHFLAGRYDYFNRYEIYIWTFSLLIGIYLIAPKIIRILEKENSNLIKVIIFSIITIGLLNSKYIIGLFDIPIASNNIFEQQYQMHRFATDYYKEPVAVNDLGYVSYNNDNYILDLFGQASREALNYMKTQNNSEWMQKLVNEKNVRLVMIYDIWFKHIPATWIKMGELYLGKKQITPADYKVAFYATDPKDYPDIKEKLQEFMKSLPQDVSFIFSKN